MDKSEVIECAEKLKKYCEEHRNKMGCNIGCDCPYSEAFNNGYLCGLYERPYKWGEQK